MRNPFVYGEEAIDESFCNRKIEIDQLIRDIHNSVNVIILSPRRYGKTSLIKQVLKKLSKKTVVVYIDLYPAVSKQKFLELYARATARAIKGKLEAKLIIFKDLLPRFIPRVVIKGDAGPEFEFDFDRTKSSSIYLDEILNAVKKYSEKHCRNAVVVFDEIQEILQYEDDEIEKAMRAAFQGHRNVSYIFMGSRRHLMESMFTDPSRPFYKSGKHLPLKRIPQDELVAFISSKFRKGKFRITRANAAQIVDFAESHPYYVQLLCHVLWDDCINKLEICEDDILAAVDSVIERERSLFLAFWDGLTRKQKALLLALAKTSEQKQQKMFSHQFLIEHDLGSASSVQKALSVLGDKGLIDRENGLYFMSDVFFKRWLQKVA